MQEHFIVILIAIAFIAVFFYAIKVVENSEHKSPVLADRDRKHNGSIPNMEKIARGPKGSCWNYYIDHKTGCIYLVHDGGYHFGLAIVQNPDGTPMTLDELANHR